MGAGISPVLSAYFQGQQVGTGQVQAAKEISDAADRRDLAKKQLDEVIRQHTAENQATLSRLDLEQQQHKLVVQKAMEDVTNNFREGVRSGAIPMSGVHLPTGIQIPQSPPGMAPQIGNAPPSALPAIPGINLPGQPQFVPNPTQSTSTPFGNVTIPTPQTDVASAVEKARALLPVKQDELNAEADSYVKKMMPSVEAKADTQKAISDARIESLERGQDIKQQIAEIMGQSKLMNMFMVNGINPDPEEFKAQVAKAAHLAATGQLEGSLTQTHGPIIGRAAQSMLDSAGMQIPAKGTRDTVTGLLNDASQFLNGIDSYKATVSAPKSKTEQITNVLADKLGIAGLSSYKSVYDMLSMDQLPRLEKTLGMTPGALSRSPKLLDKIKGIVPLPADKQNIVDAKEANGADLFLSAAARKLSSLQPAQRAMFWQDLVKDHPELVNRSQLLRDKLVNAGNTGMYEPGSFFKAFVGGK